MIRRGFITGAGAALAAACAPARTPETGVLTATAAADFPPLGRRYGRPGRRVHATDQGEGPPVVLIHGASGNLRDWTFDIAPMLAKTHRVVAMDRPGFGYSERPETAGAWRPAAQAMQLREAALEMGVKKPVVVGHSWGAAVALAWALDAPEELAGVVTVSGVTMPWGGVAPVFDALGVGSLIAGAYTRRLVSTAENGGADRFVTRAFRPQAAPEGYLDYVGAPLAIRPATLKANGDDLANTNRAIRALSERYAELKVPVEAMHGDADWLLNIRQHGAGFVAAAPTARLTPLPGVGHMAHHARPETLAALIARIA